MRLERNSYISKRYMILYGLAKILEGLVSVVTLGYFSLSGVSFKVAIFSNKNMET